MDTFIYLQFISVQFECIRLILPLFDQRGYAFAEGVCQSVEVLSQQKGLLGQGLVGGGAGRGNGGATLSDIGGQLAEALPVKGGQQLAVQVAQAAAVAVIKRVQGDDRAGMATGAGQVFAGGKA